MTLVQGGDEAAFAEIVARYRPMLLGHSRRAKAALEGTGEATVAIARIASTLEALPERKREVGIRLLSTLADVLDE